MYVCESCNEHFENPEVKFPDSGGIIDSGVIGKWKKKFINFCPDCMSTNFKKIGGTINDTKSK